jgi:hypothetical protein
LFFDPDSSSGPTKKFSILRRNARADTPIAALIPRGGIATVPQNP